MDDLNESLDNIFNPKYTWRGHPLSWCELCGVYSVSFDCCKNGSCGGGGCEKCHDESAEFSKEYKTWPEYYLTDEEIKAVEKYKAIKKFIPVCIDAGFKEINFEYLDEKGLMSLRDMEHLRKQQVCEETVSDGFGGEWSKKCPMCHDISIHVVRPGKVQCYNCD
jgi:hypothetical protein